MQYELYSQYEDEHGLHETPYYRENALDAVKLACSHACHYKSQPKITWWSVAVFDNSRYPPRTILDMDSTDN